MSKALNLAKRWLGITVQSVVANAGPVSRRGLKRVYCAYHACGGRYSTRNKRPPASKAGKR